tara:strand:+ start:1239 stop:1976 length:738 start_codon:yes stop_codon:yes gene_type:complete
VGFWKRLLTTSDFSEGQITDLQALVFDNPTVSINRTPPSFEKGVSTTINFNYSADAGNDTFVSGQILDGGSNVEENNVGISGLHTATGLLDTVKRKYQANFTLQGNITSPTATSTVVIPQYVGISTVENFHLATQATLLSHFDKFLSTSNFIQSSNAPGTNLANGTIGFAAEHHYIYFISKNNNLVIYDQTNLPQNMTTEFVKTTITVELANETPQQMYQYRSVETKDFSTEVGGKFGYKLASAG